MEKTKIKFIFFLLKLYNLLQGDNNINIFIDLGNLSMQNFQIAVKSSKEILVYLKSKMSKDEILHEVLMFFLKELNRNLYLIGRLISYSDYYSPHLNKELIATYLNLCEVVCDPFLESLEQNENRILQFYSNLFDFSLIYKLYDIDCKEASITEEQKENLKKYLKKIGQTLRKHNYENIQNDFDKIIDSNLSLISVNIFDQGFIKDFIKISQVFPNKKKKKYILFNLIKIEYPDFEFDYTFDDAFNGL